MTDKVANQIVNIGEISLSGHELPNDKKFILDITLDFVDMSLQDCINALTRSSSPRVILNSRLGRMKVADIEALKGKLTVKVKDLYSRLARTTRPPTKDEALDTLANLPRDEYVDFMMDNGLTEELAIISYNRKHKIVNPS